MRSIKLYFFLLSVLFIAINNKSLAQPANQDDHNYEIVLTYIGSGSCPVCNDNRLPVLFQNIYSSLLNNHPYEIRVIGITINQDIISGQSHLNKVFTKFDEIIISKDIYSIGALRYMHEKFRGRAFVPQVLVSIRELKKSRGSTLPSDKYFTKETLLLRKLGLKSIQNFSNVIDELNISSLVRKTS